MLRTTYISRLLALFFSSVLSVQSLQVMAQDEDLSNLTLGLSGNPAEAEPTLSFFTRNGFDPQIHRIYSLPGKGLGIDAYDSNGVCMLIHNDARPQALTLGGDGVGIGVSYPQEALHIFSNDFFLDATGAPVGFEQARILLENDKSQTQIRTMLELVNNGGSRMLFDNTDTGEAWALMNNSADAIVFSRGGTGGAEFILRKDGGLAVGPGNQTNLFLASNGNLTIAGSLNQQSDRNAKEKFAAVDCDEVLDKVMDLEITSWKYKDDQDRVRHMGPMAQDFHAAFNVGLNEKTISPIDTAGVTLAAVKALNQRLEEKEDRIRQLEEQVAQLMSLMNQK